MHFDEFAYSGTSDTNLYKLVDALAGTTGAGALVNEIFLARMGGALQTIYFNELDYIFGKISFLARSPAESYALNPLRDQLTSDQWDEVRVKDAWYRARIMDFFKACTLGGTPEGIRMCVQAALAVDADIYEVWRYKDNFGLLADLGRSPHIARNEVVVKPHKSTLAPVEMRLVRDMLDRICPMDSIITVNTQGLAVMSPIPVQAAAADSTYYEVQRLVTATPVLSQLPPPELLPIDLLPSEQWLYAAQHDPTLAPYTAFNISAEYGYYYLAGGGSRSPIDSVTYGTIQPGREGSITVYECSGTTIQLQAQGLETRLGDPVSNFLGWLGGVFAPPGGIHFPPLCPGPEPSYFATNLDPDEFNYVGIPYPDQVFPWGNAITTATATLVSRIQNTPGPFVLIGTSQGATVVSNVYDQIRNGVLANRRSDLLAGITFSNPRRQAAHDFPLGPHPGGHGARVPNLSGTEDLWWDFVRPGDPNADVGDDATGTLTRSLFSVMTDQYQGDPSALTGPLGGLGSDLMPVVGSVHNFWSGFSATPSYGSWQPIAGDARLAYEIALDYIQGFTGISNTNPDLMSTYRREANFAVFNTTGQFTAPVPYEKADSSDNFPGGKYGIHPSYAPALNPDGTPYTFQYVSQAAYVADKSAQVIALGGRATADSYQLPISAPNSSARVFPPDQAIAFFPPAKDSTVTMSLTHRRSDLSNQFTPEIRDPVNFQRSH